MLIEIKNNFKDEVTKAQGTVLVDCWAPWCGPCKTMGTILEGISEKLKDIKFCKVNVEDYANIATEYGVSSLPTLILFKNGKEIRRTVGVRPAGSIEKFINGEGA